MPVSAPAITEACSQTLDVFEPPLPGEVLWLELYYYYYY